MNCSEEEQHLKTTFDFDMGPKNFIVERREKAILAVCLPELLQKLDNQLITRASL